MKRIIVSLLVLLILCPAPAVLAAEAPPEDGIQEPAPAVEIATGTEFAAFAADCARDVYSRDVTFSLTADIDLTGTGFAPIPYFAGTFRGNGHMILGLDVGGEGSRMGLFRTVAEGATVSNLHVRGAVTPTGTREYVGGIAGENLGTIENCSFEGTVTGLEYVGGVVGTNRETGVVTGCSFRGDVTAEHQVGGVAGANIGLISKCENTGSINNVLITPESEPSLDLSALSQEDLVDLANIGGIAGDNAGVLSDCRNTGVVGFNDTGYNVGGICGKTSGYIVGCENRGQILGRRDVGGIAGQLVPYAVWNFDNAAMETLEKQLNSLHYVIAGASKNAEENNEELTKAIANMNHATTQAIKHLEDAMRINADNSEKLDDRIQVDPETGEITIKDSNITGIDHGALADSLAELHASSNALSETLHTSLTTLTEDLQRLGGQTSQVMDSIYGLLEQVSDGNLYSVRDLSADETYDHDLGAVADSVSYGDLSAENNAGGVVGSIGFDIEFDRENTLDASQFITAEAEQSLFAAVRGCAGYGEITARDSRAGGIAGSMDMGCLADCVSAGAIASRDGDYAGGTVGYAAGTLTGCWARSVLNGNKYVGGTAGLGENILHCRAWTHMEAASEYAGAVAGWTTGTVEENLYVEFTPAGVDGVSFSGQTDPVTDAQLLALEGVPAGFGAVTVTFADADGEIVEVREVPFGGALGDLPVIENNGNAYWQWDDVDAQHIYFSQTVTGKYYAPETVLDWGGEPPILLVEGVFYQGQTLTAAAYDWPEAVEALASYSVVVNDYDGELVVHLRAESGGTLYQFQDGGSTHSRIAYRTDGQYIVFTLTNGDSFVYLAPTRDAGHGRWLTIGGVALGALALGLLILRRQKKKTAGTQSAPLTAAGEMSPASELPEAEEAAPQEGDVEEKNEDRDDPSAL